MNCLKVRGPRILSSASTFCGTLYCPIDRFSQVVSIGSGLVITLAWRWRHRRSTSWVQVGIVPCVKMLLGARAEAAAVFLDESRVGGWLGGFDSGGPGNDRSSPPVDCFNVV